MKCPVSVLSLSTRPNNCLRNAGIKTVGELIQKSEAELLKMKYIGRKSLIEIQTALAAMGLSLGMTFDKTYRR